MLSVSDKLIDLFKKSHTVKIGAGAFLEHNMNSMLQNITVTTTATDQDYISQITPTIKINPFKKLFPVDSIIKSFRPKNSGVKYYVDSDAEYPSGDEHYSTLRTFEYPENLPRIYYAGESNEYKYFLTPMGKSLDVTIKYVHKTITVKEAYSNSKKIFFTTSGSHGFTSGLEVSVTGMGSLSKSGIISSVPETNVFTIDDDQIATQKIIQNGLATLDVSTKPALLNRIIVKFEEYHYVPSNCYIYIKRVGQAEESIGQFTINRGKVDLHYKNLNGVKSWAANPSTYPWTFESFKYADPIEIEHIKITAPNSSGQMIALVELSPRWVQDISDDLVSFELQKESSSNSEDILPVGKVTSNSLSMSIARYKDFNNNQDELQIVNYNFDNKPLNKNLIYMFSKSMVVPYFKVFHNDAEDIPGVNDFIPQGEFYLDSWQIKDRGEASIEAFDSAKILMDAFAPQRYYESLTATGVITGILDSIGFTDYKFNLTTVSNQVLGREVYEDSSVPVINYWWSDGTKSVWECIQEICNDIQMNAIVDENGTLQFYSRDYMYSHSEYSDFTFTYKQEGDVLANIISFSHKEIPSSNQVKIIYNSPFNSNLVGTSENLFVAPVSYLAAGALLAPITTNSPTEGQAIEIQIDQLTEFNNIQSPFSFQGYVVINSEVIEYDAIEYKLMSRLGPPGVIIKGSLPSISRLPVVGALGDGYLIDGELHTWNGNAWANVGAPSSQVQYVWVESEADVAKYRNIAQAQEFDLSMGVLSSTFAPSNKLRVKKRGALGTTISSHYLTSKAFEGGGWKAYKATWA